MKRDLVLKKKSAGGVLVLSGDELVFWLTPVHDQLLACMCTRVCESGGQVQSYLVHSGMHVGRAGRRAKGLTRGGTDAHMDQSSWDQLL